MNSLNSCTIVVPTRNDAQACCYLLDALLVEAKHMRTNLRVVFLANDTNHQITQQLKEPLLGNQYATLKPRLLEAAQDWPTAEENVRHTLGENLDAVDDIFLIIGNTDRIDGAGLQSALDYLLEHQLDLLLIGVINREVNKGRYLQQFYTTPRHLNPKNRLSAEATHGADIFANALSDYGLVDYLAYLGCQLYTKNFFRELCRVEAEFSEPLYSVPLATLELTTRTTWAVGFFPGVVAIRVDDLDQESVAAERYNLDRGLSSHFFLSIISNSLHLSDSAFQILVNSQAVSVARGGGHYRYVNFLFLLVTQTANYLHNSQRDATYRYCSAELKAITSFARRLGTVDIGLSPGQCSVVCSWLEHIGAITDYEDSVRIGRILAACGPVLALLEERLGMDRWVAQLNTWPPRTMSGNATGEQNA